MSIGRRLISNLNKKMMHVWFYSYTLATSEWVDKPTNNCMWTLWDECWKDTSRVCCDSALITNIKGMWIGTACEKGLDLTSNDENWNCDWLNRELEMVVQNLWRDCIGSAARGRQTFYWLDHSRSLIQFLVSLGWWAHLTLTIRCGRGLSVASLRERIYFRTRDKNERTINKRRRPREPVAQPAKQQ